MGILSIEKYPSASVIEPKIKSSVSRSYNDTEAYSIAFLLSKLITVPSIKPIAE